MEGDGCGFDPARWRPRDVTSLYGALGEWSRLAGVELDGALPTVLPEDEAALLEAGHAAGHLLWETARGLPQPPVDGRVDQINTSGGGVPKLPVDEVDVDHGGV